MDALIIIITILMFATAIMMGLTVYGIFSDKDKDGIPDALENKFKELKDDIKEQISKIKE
jgi:uracil DNA glycosylase